MAVNAPKIDSKRHQISSLDNQIYELDRQIDEIRRKILSYEKEIENLSKISNYEEIEGLAESIRYSASKYISIILKQTTILPKIFSNDS